MRIYLLAIVLLASPAINVWAGGDLAISHKSDPTNALASSDLTSVYVSSDSAIVNALRADGTTFTHDNSVTLLMNGQEKFDDMFAAIRQAKSSVHLEYFNFRNDSIASELFAILKDKVKQGVEVRALFDAFGNDSNNQPLKKHHVKSLREAGIDIHEYDPIRFPWINHVFSRDHRKIVIIDGRIAYTGGMNVADYYIKGTEQVGEWRDMHCRIEGSEVNTLQHIFARIWQRETGEFISDGKYYRGSISRFVGDSDATAFSSLKPDTTTTAHHKMVGIINREPRKTNKIIRQFYCAAIDNARDSVRIINPYFTLTPSIRRSIKKAIKRGVKVEIMVSAHSDIPLTPDCVFYEVHKLMKRGAHVWLYQPGFHHTKVIMVDGKLCTVGSANLNSRSLRWDYEENAVIVDRGTTNELDQMFDRDKQKSVYLTDETWKAFRSPWQRFVGWFAHLFTPFL